MKKLILGFGMAVFLSSSFAVDQINNFEEPNFSRGQKQGFFGRRGHKGHKGHKGHHGKNMIGKIMQKLDLTDEQKETLKGLRTKHKEENQALHDQLKTSQKELRALSMGFDEVDEKTLKTKFDQASEIRYKLLISRMDMKKKMQSVLTDDQKAKLKELMKNFQQNMKNRGNRGNKRRNFNQFHQLED